MIVTGGFSKYLDFLKSDLFLVSISPDTPKYFVFGGENAVCRSLAPECQLYRGHRYGYVTDDTFKKEYTASLLGINLSKVLNALISEAEMQGKKGVALLSGDSDTDTFHRNILVDYIKKESDNIAIC